MAKESWKPGHRTRIGEDDPGEKNDLRGDTGANSLDDLQIRDADDPGLGLTNVADQPAEDWAANTGPTRSAEDSGGVEWDPLRSRRTPPSERSGGIPDLRERPRNLEQCLVAEIQDLYQAESEQAGVLNKLAGAASASELKSAFEDHLAETQQHVQRLGQIMEMTGESAGGSGTLPTSVAGIIAESNEKLERQPDPRLRDLAIIAAAQKMEHNEMASYGTARALAHTLGRDEEARLLQTTLTEEEHADKRLTQIALRLLKHAGGAESA